MFVVLRRRLTRALDALVSPEAPYLAHLVLVLVLLGGVLFPAGWQDNEMHYFDLGYRFARPDAFGPWFAAVDALSFRSLGLYIIGYSIDAVGFERAHLGLTLLVWGLQSAALAFALQALRIPLAATALAMVAFWMEGQSLIGGEWLFDAVEGKVFAYAAVFLALGLVLQGHLTGAALMLILATYLHFQVGGFWGLALVALAALRGASARKGIGMGALFLVGVLPLMWILLSGRFGAEVDLTGIDLTVNQIYAAFRHAHHVAPFEDPEFFQVAWRMGAILTAVSALGWAVLALWRGWPRRMEAVWLAGLSTYLLLALGLAWLDRATHALGTLYIFRPSALTLLLTLLVLIAGVLALAPVPLRRGVAAAALAVFATQSLPQLVREVQKGASAETLEASLRPAEAELVAWARTETRPEQPILVLGWPAQGRQFSRWGFERLTRRPTMVEYKYVPTAPDDLVRWYRLLRWQRALFGGAGCARLSEFPVQYVVTTGGAVAESLRGCTTPAFQSDAFEVLQVAGHISE